MQQESSEVRRWWQKLPFGLFGLLLIVGFIESRPTDPLSLERLDKSSLAWRYSAELAESSDVLDAEILCFGDSIAKLGLQPRVFEEKLGLQTFNLAMFGAQTPATYYVLRRTLDAGARPRLVILEAQENLLAVAPRSNGDEWPDLLNAEEWIDFSINGLDENLTIKLGLTLLLPNYRDRHAIRTQILADLQNQERSDLGALQTLYRNWEHNLGAQVVPEDDRTALPIAPLQAGTPRGHWQPHRVNLWYWKRILRLLEEEGLSVVWLLPPTRSDWNVRRQALGVQEPFNRFVHEIQAEFPTLIVIDGRSSQYPEEVFKDATHLNGTGAVALTSGVVEAIGPILDNEEVPPRTRLVLNEFSVPAPRQELEDLHESRRVISLTQEGIRR